MIALLLACVGSSAPVPTATATRGPFEVTLEVQGELEAKRKEVVTAPDFDGSPKIAWIVEEGTRVKKGDKVVEFETAEMEDALDTARSALEIARTKIEQNQAQLELKIADAEGAIRGVELDLRMARMRVTDSETVPLVDREDARANAQRAEMALVASRSALESTRLQARAELQLLQLEVEENERRVAKLERQLESATLTAPTDGLAIIYERWDGKLKAGSQPWSGSELVTLPDLSTMQAVVWVHEVDSPRVALEQTALVTMDAHPEAPIEAKVSRVADLAVARGEEGIKHLKVTLDLFESTDRMKPGMTVRAKLQLESLPDVLHIPLEAVQHDNGASYVYTSGGVGGWTRVDVRLGSRSDTRVVVEEGLTDGALVALADPFSRREAEPTKPGAEPEPKP